MRIYLSHPYGLKEENRERARRIAAWYRKTWAREGKEYELVDPLAALEEEAKKPGATEERMLEKAVELMLSCDAVIFAGGWKKSPGCRHEHMMALHHGLKIGFIPPEFCALFERRAA